MSAMALVFAAALVFVAWRDALPLLARLVRLAEVRWLPAPTGAPEPLLDLSLPPDVEQLALGESEEWARESVRERARELYRACDHDWDRAKQILYTERQATIFGGHDAPPGEVS